MRTKSRARSPLHPTKVVSSGKPPSSSQISRATRKIRSSSSGNVIDLRVSPVVVSRSKLL